MCLITYYEKLIVVIKWSCKLSIISKISIDLPVTYFYLALQFSGGISNVTLGLFSKVVLNESV